MLQIPNHPITFVAILVFLIAIVIAFLIGTHIDQVRKEKKVSYPKTKPVRYSKEVERLLEVEERLDEFERKIS